MEKITDDIRNSALETIRSGDSSIIVNGKEYFPLGITNALVATKDKQAKEYFNAKAQRHKMKAKHSAWFILDLETGGRKIYPGCKRYGTVIAADSEYMFMFPEADVYSRPYVYALSIGMRVEILERFSQKDLD